MKSSIFVAGTLALAMSAACGGSQSPAAPPASPAAAPTAAVAAPVAGEEMKVAPQEEPQGDIQFQAALDLNQNPGAAPGQLRGGEEARSTDWPASLYVTFKTSGGMASCTAALLGPQVMLTAAHCVPANGTVSFVYVGHAQPYTTSCTRHPRYPADASADYALCSVKPNFAAPAGFRYESVNGSAMSTIVKRPIVLTGFGCISDIAGAGPSDGKYRIGGNTIDETSDSTTRRRGAAYYAPAQTNNLFTTDSAGTANLCPGDSGGPAFMRSAGGVGTFTNRTIIGVNSRVFYANATATTYGSSLISATGGPDFLAWAEDWAKTNKASACGIIGNLTTCRS